MEGATEAPAAVAADLQKRPREGDAGDAAADPAAKRQKVDGASEVKYTREKGPENAVVWIREYMTQGVARPKCVLKARYEDFVVREVTKAGEVTRLTTLDVPEGIRAASEAGGGDLPADPAERATLGLEALLEHKVDASIVEGLKAALNKKSSLARGVEVPISGVGLTKEERTALHQLVKKYFPKLTSFAKDDVVKVQLKTDSQRENKWPRGRGDYLHFTLYKENLETQACFKALAQKLHCVQKTFATAGTKDKRAITTQRVSAYRVQAERVQSLNFDRFGPGVAKFGEFSYEQSELRLGMLEGNRFSIVMRKCDGDPEDIKKTLDAAGKRGFINYYGNQRFGSTKVPTYRVAEQILAGEGVEALNVLFTSKAEIVKEFAPAAAAYAKDPMDPSAALALCPQWCGIEASILRALLKNPKDIMSGFATLHRNTRALYFHALQSVVWNEIATERIRRHGTAPVVGDLVYDGTGAGHRSLPKVRRLTADDVATKPGEIAEFTLVDVVLPLPGCDPELGFPELDGARRADYSAALSKYSASGLLSGADASAGGASVAKSLAKSMNLYGGYRPLAAVPGDFTYSFTRYAADDDTIQRTEWRGGEHGLVPSTSVEPVAGFGEPEGSGEGPQLAMRLSFTLPSSVYATMFIREIADATTCNV